MEGSNQRRIEAVLAVALVAAENGLDLSINDSPSGELSFRFGRPKSGLSQRGEKE